MEMKTEADTMPHVSRRARRALRRLCAIFRLDDGATAIEFAFIGPILVMMIIGVVEAGRLYYFQSSLQNRVEDDRRQGVEPGEKLAHILPVLAQ